MKSAKNPAAAHPAYVFKTQADAPTQTQLRVDMRLLAEMAEKHLVEQSSLNTAEDFIANMSRPVDGGDYMQFIATSLYETLKEKIGHRDFAEAGVTPDAYYNLATDFTLLGSIAQRQKLMLETIVDPDNDAVIAGNKPN